MNRLHQQPLFTILCNCGRFPMKSISLVDLAEAIKADKERGKGKTTEKPSIRAQLKVDKERAGKKKPKKQKSQDLERS